jgi:hypothetical protein
MIEYIQKLTAVINTLNRVEVKGRDNLNALLGSIQMIESVCQAMSKAEEGGDDNG